MVEKLGFITLSKIQSTASLIGGTFSDRLGYLVVSDITEVSFTFR